MDSGPGSGSGSKATSTPSLCSDVRGGQSGLAREVVRSRSVAHGAAERVSAALLRLISDTF